MRWNSDFVIDQGRMVWVDVMQIVDEELMTLWEQNSEIRDAINACVICGVQVGAA